MKVDFTAGQGTARIKARESTVLWTGDVIVLGAGLAGLSAAKSAVEKGKKVCLLEPGPSLGVEVSRMWVDSPAQGAVGDYVVEFCKEHNTFRDGRIDILSGTLAFDRFADESGIDCIVCVLPMRPLRDAKGFLVGVEVAGKSGRQAVLAPIVVDATQGRVFSRRVCGAGLPVIRSAVQRVYLHGVEIPKDGLDLELPENLMIPDNRARCMPAVWRGEAILSFSADTADGSPSSIKVGSLARATKLVEYLKQNEKLFTAATLVDVAPDFSAVYEPDDGVFDVLSETGLMPLPLAGELDEEASLSEKAVAHMPACDARRQMPDIGVSGKAEAVDTCELSAAKEQDLEKLDLPEADAFVHEHVDVVVAGCGAGGAHAAITAAERGASVKALEPQVMPGGITSAGRIHNYYHGLRNGIQRGLDEVVDERTKRLGDGVRGFHPLAKAVVLLEAMRESGVDYLNGHIVFGVVKNGRGIKAVVSADASGYHIFPCSVAVDGTGDGDLAVAAGAGFTLGRPGDGFPQPYSYTPVSCRSGNLSGRNFDSGWTDPTDALEYSRAHFHGRAEILKQQPFSEEFHYCTLAPLIGIRESRFVRGGVTLSFEDFLEGKTFPDTVCAAYAHYDNHAIDYAEESDWAFRHVVMFGLWSFLCRGHVPYSALLASGVDGILMACRALSVDHDLHQLIRMQPDMQQLGEICGVAAAMSARSGVPPAEIDISGLQNELRERGIFPEPVEPVMQEPAETLLSTLGSEQNGLAMWRLFKMKTEQTPDWDKFFETEKDPRRRLSAAIVLALRSIPDNNAREILRKTVRERLKEPRAGLKAPMPYVSAALALAFIPEDGDVDEIGRLLLLDDIETTSIVLILKALDIAGDPAGVKYVREFLARNKDNQFEIPLWGCDQQWKTSLRFAVELRAVKTLVKLGCCEENAILDSYVNHENLLIRRYARRLADMSC